MNVSQFILRLFFFCSLTMNFFPVQCIPLASNKYYYMLARNELRDMETKSQNFHELSEREKIVHFYFENLKQQEYIDTSDRFLPSLPVEDVIDEIMNRQLYQVIKYLPKGGNLHMHEPEMLDRKVFLNLIQNDDELFDMLYICDKFNKPECALKACNCSSYQLKYFAKNNPDDGWTKVRGSAEWPIDAILNKTTLAGIFKNLPEKLKPTDSNGRWKVANQAGDFTFYDPLLNHNKTRFMYMEACLDLSLKEGVQIVEFRRGNFGTLFYFDMDGNQVTISAENELLMLRQFKEEYVLNNPEFIDFVFIIYGIRRFSKEDILQDMRLAIETQKKFPDMIRGYDLVGEEDLGHTLLFHSDSLIEAFNYMENDSKHTFTLNFHVAETNWPDDFNPTMDGDDVSTLNNVYDSLLMHTHRIGHGLGFIKHPELYPFIKENKIAIEVCPTSNQILGFVPDLRSHQALNYYRSGIPIVIAGDDPGSFGYNELTVDYYQVFMAWGLTLADLKEIANNSITYSTIPHEKRLKGFEKFEREWDQYIDFMYMRACNRESDLDQVTFFDMQPNFGPNDISNKISFFGNGFEQLICKSLSCVFGNVVDENTRISTKCELKTLHEIQCDTPIGFKSNTTLTLALSANDRILFTKFSYTFISDKYFKQDLTKKNVMKNDGMLTEKTKVSNVLSAFNDVLKAVKSNFF